MRFNDSGNVTKVSINFRFSPSVCSLQRWNKNGVAFFAKTSFIEWLSVFINSFSVYARSLRLHPTVGSSCYFIFVIFKSPVSLSIRYVIILSPYFFVKLSFVLNLYFNRISFLLILSMNVSAQQ